MNARMRAKFKTVDCKAPTEVQNPRRGQTANTPEDSHFGSALPD